MRRLEFLFALLLILVTKPSHSRIQVPSKEFRTHKIVRPRIYHGRSKREITSTKLNGIEHFEALSVVLELDDVARILDLRLNTDLISKSYTERFQFQGDYKTHILSKVELCHYQGSIRGVPGSWAAISTCQGLKGVIFDGESLQHIHPKNENLQAAHFLYKHSDLITNLTCGYRGAPLHGTKEIISAQKTNHASRWKRTAETIRGPYNANQQSRYVELVFVIDKVEYKSLGENLTRVHQHCKDIANIINALYTPLNIFIALVGVEVWTDSDEIHLLSNGDVTLNNFLQYRRERLVKMIPNDNAQLLTKLQFDEGVVGKALKGPICTYEFSGGVSVDHSSVVGLVAATVAHEMGHNFGMEHDSAECNCPEEKCIMAPSSGSSGPVHWSSCSLEYLALAFEHGMDYCLRNKPKRLFDSPICGNGFVEPGEQCDCGLIDHCDNPCCNASSCMLHKNASCATGECCDLETCRPKSAGKKCRSADHECDLAEYCTGESEYCPIDVFKIDGESCSMGKAYCYQGNCRTHNDQCKLLWGPTGTSSDSLCYEMNNQGTKNGNCGFNRTGNSYIKCHDQNILCGMLHCKHLNERLEFGMESVAILSHSFLNSRGNIIACRSAIVDLGLNQVDPGLAPNGAKCAQGKMCVNQKCISISELRLLFPGSKTCPNNCSDNGVCNSLGHCHCNRGFKPPDCTQPGVGGSEDSGPAEDPNARSEYVVSLYIIFLGIVPTIGIISFGVWYSRNNCDGAKQWKKTCSAGPISTLSRNFIGQQVQQQHHFIDGGQPTITTVEPDISRGSSKGIDPIESNLATVQQDPACASLLPKTNNDKHSNNNFFGKFKGFSISPLTQKSTELETRGAPPLTITSSESSTTINALNMNWCDTSRRRLNNSTLHTLTKPVKTNLESSQSGGSLVCPQQFTAQIKPVLELNGPTLFPPALPPPNIGITARPLISSPVLAATTFSSVEFIDNVPKMPTRTAPDIPIRRVNQQQSQQQHHLQGHRLPRSKSMSIDNNSLLLFSNKGLPDKKMRSRAKSSNFSTLTRIASILYPISGVINKSSDAPPTNYNTNSLTRLPKHRAIKLVDKEILRSLEISHPIPLNEIKIPSSTIPLKADPVSQQSKTPKSQLLSRGLSMRDTKLIVRPAIYSFGSMRQANSTRRTCSTAARVRPTSPPPRPPIKIAAVASSNMNNPSEVPKTRLECTYDDCMNLSSDANLVEIMEESSLTDNIYAVIADSGSEKNSDESQITSSLFNNQNCMDRILKNTENSSNKSADIRSDPGLLSEIVLEISYRNLDSIYSTKTLTDESSATSQSLECERMSKDSVGSNYNFGTGSLKQYKPPSSLYSNSTTSSGYLHPSALNVPPIRQVKRGEQQSLSLIIETGKNGEKEEEEINGKEHGDLKKEDKKENLKTKVIVKPSHFRIKTQPSPQKLIQQADINKFGLQNSDSSFKCSKDTIPSSSNNNSNSPDLISSCSSIESPTSPDVLSQDNKCKSVAIKSKIPTLSCQKDDSSKPSNSSNLLFKTTRLSNKRKASITDFSETTFSKSTAMAMPIQAENILIDCSLQKIADDKTEFPMREELRMTITDKE